MTATAGKADDGTYEWTCPDCGFRSFGWEKKADATARAGQHQDEHDTGEQMPEVADFTRKG